MKIIMRYKSFILMLSAIVSFALPITEVCAQQPFRDLTVGNMFIYRYYRDAPWGSGEWSQYYIQRVIGDTVINEKKYAKISSMGTKEPLVLERSDDTATYVYKNGREQIAHRFTIPARNSGDIKRAVDSIIWSPMPYFAGYDTTYFQDYRNQYIAVVTREGVGDTAKVVLDKVIPGGGTIPSSRFEYRKPFGVAQYSVSTIWFAGPHLHSGQYQEIKLLGAVIRGKVYGDTVFPKVSIRFGDAAGYPGDTIRVPIYYDYEWNLKRLHRYSISDPMHFNFHYGGVVLFSENAGSPIISNSDILTAYMRLPVQADSITGIASSVLLQIPPNPKDTIGIIYGGSINNENGRLSAMELYPKARIIIKSPIKVPLSAPTLEARLMQPLRIPLELSNLRELRSANIRQVMTTLTFNASVLELENSMPSGIIQNGKRTIPLIFTIPESGDTARLFLQCRAVVGNTTATLLTFGAVTVTNPNIRIASSTATGQVQIRGINQAGNSSALYFGGTDYLVPNSLVAMPNPFDNTVLIRYELALPVVVKVDVYTALGQYLLTLYQGRQFAGQNRVEWSGQNASGTVVPPGMYIVRLEFQDGSSAVISIVKR